MKRVCLCFYPQGLQLPRLDGLGQAVGHRLHDLKAVLPVFQATVVAHEVRDCAWLHVSV